MLRKDYGNRCAHIIQPNKKKRPANSVISAPIKQQSPLSSLEIIHTNIKQYRPMNIPQSDIESTPSVMFSVSPTSIWNNSDAIYEYSPSIMEFPVNERQQVFNKRIQQCYKLCNFNDPNQKQKIEDKRRTLEDLINSLKRTTLLEILGNEEYQAIFRLFLKHTDRTPPNDLKIQLSVVDSDQNTVFTEDGWDHISIVYDLLLIVLTDRKFNQRQCRASQLKKVSYSIIHTISSPDKREREKLCKIFHHYYVALVSQRAFVRKFASDFFMSVAQNEISPIGTAELLSAYIPVVSGFKVPLLQDHVQTFSNIILPLHKSPYLLNFHVQLVNLITTFIEKQRSLGIQALSYILGIWPKTSSTKEVNLMLEAGHYIDILGTEIPSDVIVKLAKIVANCANSNSFNLCERTLMRWQSDYFTKTIAYYPYETFKILLPALFKTVKLHWCEDIKKLAMSTIIAIKQSNPVVFEQVGQEIKNFESERLTNEVKRIDLWKTIAIQAELSEQLVNDFIAKLKTAVFEY